MKKATLIFNKIETTRKSIKNLNEWLKFNEESCIREEMKNSLTKRESELIKLQSELDQLFKQSI